jgi:ribonuclease P protein component
MLPRIHRLHLEREIMAVMRKGRRCSGVLTTLFCLPNRLPVSRFGFVVSKKVSNKTTRRNLVKRRLRGVILKVHKQLAGGYDCLLLAKPVILNQDFPVIEQEVLGLLRREKVFKPNPTNS